MVCIVDQVEAYILVQAEVSIQDRVEVCIRVQEEGFILVRAEVCTQDPVEAFTLVRLMDRTLTKAPGVRALLELEVLHGRSKTVLDLG